jgi:hypothetical protein
VPPEVVTGRVVVVVGGKVVVVVGGEVVVVGDGETEFAPESDGGGVVVGGDVTVVEVLGVELPVVDVVGTCNAGVLDAVLPGCSLAINTPTATVAPVAARAARRVRRRREASARRRVSGEWDFMNHFLGSAQAHGNSGGPPAPSPYVDVLEGTSGHWIGITPRALRVVTYRRRAHRPNQSTERT